MRIKAALCLAVLLAALAAAMLILCFNADTGGGAGLLLVTPSVSNTQGFNTGKLEELCEDGLLLTYEIHRSAAVNALNSSHSVMLIGTNSRYRDVMKCPISDGGFFTETAYDSKSRHTVLNITAAYKLFGGVRVSGNTLRMDNETWIVTGVIDDGDEENSNVYVPSTISGGQPESLMVRTSGNETHVKEQLKSAGVQESSFDYISLSKTVSAFWQRLLAALFASIAVLLFLLAREASSLLRVLLVSCRERLAGMYFREWAARNSRDFFKITGCCAALPVCLVAILLLSLRILAIFLSFRDFTPPDGSPLVRDFWMVSEHLHMHHILGVVLFAAYLAALAAEAVVVFYIRRKKP